jgi:hypothetical protein
MHEIENIPAYELITSELITSFARCTLSLSSSRLLSEPSGPSNSFNAHFIRTDAFNGSFICCYSRKRRHQNNVALGRAISDKVVPEVLGDTAGKNSLQSSTA